MTKITLELEAGMASTLRLSPKELANEIRVAACVQWYSQGILSQCKAAEFAELTRVEFLEELFRRNVPACQVTLEELMDEIEEK